MEKEERLYFYSKGEGEAAERKKTSCFPPPHKPPPPLLSPLDLETNKEDEMNDAAAKAAVRPLSLKDLRLQLRARGLTPAGGLDTLRLRLEEHMAETGDW